MARKNVGAKATAAALQESVYWGEMAVCRIRVLAAAAHLVLALDDLLLVHKVLQRDSVLGIEQIVQHEVGRDNEEVAC